MKANTEIFETLYKKLAASIDIYNLESAGEKNKT